MFDLNINMRAVFLVFPLAYPLHGIRNTHENSISAKKKKQDHEQEDEHNAMSQNTKRRQSPGERERKEKK